MHCEGSTSQEYPNELKLLHTPSCAHINPLHPFAAPSNHLCEHRSKSLTLAIFLGCEASVFYIASKILIHYQILLLPIKHLSTHFCIISLSHLITKIIPSFWTEMMFVKQVPFWLVHSVWAFYSIFICPYHEDLPSFISFHNTMWVHHHDIQFWTKYAVVKQLQ